MKNVKEMTVDELVELYKTEENGEIKDLALIEILNKMEVECLDYDNIGSCYQTMLLPLFLVRQYSDFPLKAGSHSLYQIGVNTPQRQNNLI